MTRNLSTVIEELETCASTEGALIKFEKNFKPIGAYIHGNRDGFIRLAIECIRAAEHDIHEGSEREQLIAHEESLEYLAGGDFDRLLGLYRDDEMVYDHAPEPPPLSKEDEAREFRSYVWAMACIVTALVCTVVGAVTVVRWIWNLIW